MYVRLTFANGMAGGRSKGKREKRTCKPLPSEVDKKRKSNVGSASNAGVTMYHNR